MDRKRHFKQLVLAVLLVMLLSLVIIGGSVYAAGIQPYTPCWRCISVALQ